EPIHLRNVFVSIGEGTLAEDLNELLTDFPLLLLGSYPEFSNPEYKVKVTLESRDPGYLDKGLAELLRRLPPVAVVKVTCPRRAGSQTGARRPLRRCRRRGRPVLRGPRRGAVRRPARRRARGGRASDDGARRLDHAPGRRRALPGPTAAPLLAPVGLVRRRRDDAGGGAALVGARGGRCRRGDGAPGRDARRRARGPPRRPHGGREPRHVPLRSRRQARPRVRPLAHAGVGGLRDRLPRRRPPRPGALLRRARPRGDHEGPPGRAGAAGRRPHVRLADGRATPHAVGSVVERPPPGRDRPAVVRARRGGAP